MTISTGEFDAYGIPQGSPNRMDDLADVDTTEAREGNTIQLRGGRWVNVDGNEVAIQAGQPADLGVELWVDPEIPDPPPALDQVTADGLYVNVIGDTMTGEINMRVPLWKGARFTAPTGESRVIGMRSTASTPDIAVHDGSGTVLPLGVGSPTLADHAVSRGYLDGITHQGRNNEASKLVKTDSSGYINVTYINTDAGVATGNPTYVMAVHNNDGYLRRTAPGYLAVDYSNRSGTDGHVWRIGTIVTTTDGSGNAAFNTGRTIQSCVVMCNGDFPAHNRAASVSSFGGTNFNTTNCDPSKALRVNWTVG